MQLGAEFEQDLASRIAPLDALRDPSHAGLGHDDDLSTLLTSSWSEAQTLQKQNHPSL